MARLETIGTGRPEEIAAVRLLAGCLPDDWIITTPVRNVLPGRGRQIDSILFAHRAIIVLELKHWFGHTLADESNFWYQNGEERSNPLVQGDEHWKCLKDFLVQRLKYPRRRAGFFVHFAVILTAPPSDWSIDVRRLEKGTQSLIMSIGDAPNLLTALVDAVDDRFRDIDGAEFTTMIHALRDRSIGSDNGCESQNASDLEPHSPRILQTVHATISETAVHNIVVDYDHQAGEERGVLIRFDFAAVNVEDIRCRARVDFFYDGTSDVVPSSTQRYRTESGAVGNSTPFISHAPLTEYRDTCLFVPFRAFSNLPPAGLIHLKFRITLEDWHGRVLALSQWQYMIWRRDEPYAEIHKVSIEHDVLGSCTTRSGLNYCNLEGMMVLVDVTLFNCAGRSCDTLAFVHRDDAASTPIRSTMSPFQTVERHLYSGCTLRPEKREHRYRSAHLFVPYRAFDPNYPDPFKRPLDFKIQVLVREAGGEYRELGVPCWHQFQLKAVYQPVTL